MYAVLEYCHAWHAAQQQQVHSLGGNAPPIVAVTTGINHAPLTSLLNMSVEMIKLFTMCYDSRNVYQSAGGGLEKDDVIKGVQALSFMLTKLMNMRADAMCKVVGLPEVIKSGAIKMMQKLMNVEHERKLLQNRHVDVLMLCVLYAVCKLNGVGVSWNVLLPAYEKQPQAVRSTTMSIFMEEGEDRVDIAQFYNKVFLKRVLDLLSPEEELEEAPGLDLFSPLKKRPESIQSVVRAAAAAASGGGSMSSRGSMLGRSQLSGGNGSAIGRTLFPSSGLRNSMSIQ
ncbi:Retinoblastoma- protein 1 [Podochytrium sp. JEL0797]|nr:Retinoblastoma- protein 1 [Podochytrium sp. JEL0797]